MLVTSIDNGSDVVADQYTHAYHWCFINFKEASVINFTKEATPRASMDECARVCVCGYVTEEKPRCLLLKLNG